MTAKQAFKAEISKIVHAFEGDLDKIEAALHELIDRDCEVKGENVAADTTTAPTEAPAADGHDETLPSTEAPSV